jgi:hypothetical protein
VGACSSPVSSRLVSSRLDFGTPTSPPFGTCCKTYDGRHHRLGFLHANIRKVHFSRISFVWVDRSAFPCICLVPLKYVLLSSATISSSCQMRAWRPVAACCTGARQQQEVRMVFCPRMLGDRCFPSEQELWDGSGGIEAVICWMASGLRYERAGGGKDCHGRSGNPCLQGGEDDELVPNYLRCSVFSYVRKVRSSLQSRALPRVLSEP